MAKWGEGDPRWIVEDRPDAKNVNNWHWTEKNATEWSKEKLKSLLVGLTVETDHGSVEITELTKCEGEASANMRKSKLIFFYEWVIKCDWSGKITDSKTKHKGKLEILNLSEENDPDDIEIQVSANTAKDEAYRVKEIMRKEGVKKVREAVERYIQGLKEEYSTGMILPTNDKGGSSQQANDSAPKTNSAPSPAKQSQQPDASTSTAGSSHVGVKIAVKKITETVRFKCRAMDLYNALVNQQMAMAWTRGGVGQLEAEKGGRFSLFDGYVHGNFTKLDPGASVSMRWRMKNWPDEHYADTTLSLEEGDDETVLTLCQTGVPDQHADNTRQGWKRYYWDSMKQVFGWGSSLC